MTYGGEADLPPGTVCSCALCVHTIASESSSESDWGSDGLDELEYDDSDVDSGEYVEEDTAGLIMPYRFEPYEESADEDNGPDSSGAVAVLPGDIDRLLIKEWYVL